MKAVSKHIPGYSYRAAEVARPPVLMRLRYRDLALMAAAAGAVAVGAIAIGALAIGRLAIRNAVVGSAKFKSLKIEDLTVARLRAGEVTVSGSLNLPAANVHREAP
jgi:hypothetical protein